MLMSSNRFLRTEVRKLWLTVGKTRSLHRCVVSVTRFEGGTGAALVRRALDLTAREMGAHRPQHPDEFKD